MIYSAINAHNFETVILPPTPLSSPKALNSLMYKRNVSNLPDELIDFGPLGTAYRGHVALLKRDRAIKGP